MRPAYATAMGRIDDKTDMGSPLEPSYTWTRLMAISRPSSHLLRCAALRVFVLGVAIGATTLSGCRTTADILQIGAEATEPNPGPCPRAFALYDASRIVDFGGEAERFANVRFSGEINKVRSLCRYFEDKPIEADLELVMDLGRGPSASDSNATYEYFVAVTRKNIDVIEKQVFPLTVTFPAGADRMRVVERIDSIVIPRATDTTSGENFEIITGFVVTEAQRMFNADGKRFRVSAGQN